jgi:H+/Cl- antiporter ClcA
MRQVRTIAVNSKRYTNVIVVLGLLVLHEQLQSLLPHLRLLVSTPAVRPLRLLRLALLSFVFGFVSFACHFGLAMGPDDRHTAFRVSNVTNFARKVRVGLNDLRTWDFNRREKKIT